uniref:MSP18 n=1 Tax=Meloidogyne javanica TaxID=6303 RepID=A0A4Y6HSU3_MELJA|nr:MSP18 [Meloidogyne javanica]
MAILFTSTLLIISLLGITEGVNTGIPSGSSPPSSVCETYKGKIEHMPETARKIEWKENTPGGKHLILKKSIQGLDKVTLKIEGKECSASLNNPGTCLVDGQSHAGQLVFVTSKAKIEVDFGEAQIFSGNKCEIEIEKYDRATYVTIIKINGGDFKITPDSPPMPMPCKNMMN